MLDLDQRELASHRLTPHVIVANPLQSLGHTVNRSVDRVAIGQGLDRRLLTYATAPSSNFPCQSGQQVLQ
jgi:hypothetical protein